MNEEQYFEQFVGDDNEKMFYYIPMSVKEFEALSELRKEQVFAIAQTFGVPMSAWLGIKK